MKKWTTLIKAINPLTGELCLWMGPYINSPSKQEAQEYCNKNGLGYCEVDGEFVAELNENLKSFATKLLDDSINN